MKTERKTNSFVYVFTGDGKGKTSAALGTAVRALSHRWSVVWIAFYKEASWGMSEYELPGLLVEEQRKRFQMYLLGKGFYIQKPEKILEPSGEKKVKVASVHENKVIDDDSPDEHKAAAAAALGKAREVLSLVKAPNVLVLDEVCNAILDGLVSEDEVLDLLGMRGDCHVVLTGRSASERLIEAADLVTSMEKVKHPYDKGVLAVKGLDF